MLSFYRLNRAAATPTGGYCGGVSSNVYFLAVMQKMGVGL